MLLHYDPIVVKRFNVCTSCYIKIKFNHNFLYISIEDSAQKIFYLNADTTVFRIILKHLDP